MTCALDQGPVMRSLDVIGGFARLVRENGHGRHIFTKMSLALLAYRGRYRSGHAEQKPVRALRLRSDPWGFRSSEIRRESGVTQLVETVAIKR